MSINFCSQCGSPMIQRIPEDDDHVRAVCDQCDHVHYENPKMVVGTLPVMGERVLMCRRNIEPRKGKWTLPAGYLENGESVQDGAVRETYEETLSRVRLMGAYRMFNILFVDQIYMMFRAELISEDFGPTSESTEVCLFSESEIPWDEIAFEVIRQTLKDFFQDRAACRENGGDSSVFGFKVKDIVYKPVGMIS